MPELNFTIPHALGREEAARRLKSLLDRVKERHQDRVSNLEEEWLESGLRFKFTTFGFKIAGLTTVTGDALQADVDLPFAAMMFKGKIEKELREVLERTLT